MAWIEGRTWEMEQGCDALIEFRMFSDSGRTQAWPFTGWDVNATVSDTKGRNVYPVTPDLDPAGGIVRLILPEAIVNGLRTTKTYRYDCLMVAPGNEDADDHYLATGPVTVALRTSRRDEE